MFIGIFRQQNDGAHCSRLHKGYVLLERNRDRVFERTDCLGAGRRMLEGLERRREQTIRLLDSDLDLQDITRRRVGRRLDAVLGKECVDRVDRLLLGCNERLDLRNMISSDCSP